MTVDVVVRQCGDHRGHADAAEPDDHNGLAGLRPAGVDDGPTAGQHGASEQRCHRRRHVGGHGYHRATVDDRVCGEAGDPEVVVDGLAVARQPPFAGHQRARAVGGAAGFAGGQPVRGARRAVATSGQKRHDDALPDRHVRHGGPGLLDDARCLVAEQHRHRAHPVAVDHRQIGMAEAGGLDADQKLGVAGRCKFELADGDGP